VAAYSASMVADMAAVIAGYADFGVPVTFALRAEYVEPSWRELAPLLASPLTTVTLWAHRRPTSREMTWLLRTLRHHRTMYDVGFDPEMDRKWWDRVLVAGLTVMAVGTGWAASGGATRWAGGVGSR